MVSRFCQVLIFCISFIFLQACTVIWGIVMTTVYMKSITKPINLTNDNNLEDWVQNMSELHAVQTALPRSIINSWDQKFYTDLLVIETDEQADESKDCPLSHPEELIFSVWPGTIQACDCEKNDGKRVHNKHMHCMKPEADKDPPAPSFS